MTAGTDCLGIARAVAAAVCLVQLPAMAGCGDAVPPVAAPEVGLSRSRVPLGGPVDMHYRFAVAQDAGEIPDGYRVFVHFLDADGNVMFTDDHAPPEATGEWRPGQEISYDRQMYIPVYPYVGAVTVAVGLYSPELGDRLPLAGEHLGQLAYRVATLEMVPQFLTYEDGWYEIESGPGSDWRWTAGRATVSFRNPRSDARLHLQVHGYPELFETPRQLTLAVGETEIETLTLASESLSYHAVDLPAEALGDDDSVVLTLSVDATFVPVETIGGDNPDTRELGVQVFRASLEVQ